MFLSSITETCLSAPGEIGKREIAIKNTPLPKGVCF